MGAVSHLPLLHPSAPIWLFLLQSTFVKWVNRLMMHTSEGISVNVSNAMLVHCLINLSAAQADTLTGLKGHLQKTDNRSKYENILGNVTFSRWRNCCDEEPAHDSLCGGKSTKYCSFFCFFTLYCINDRTIDWTLSRLLFFTARGETLMKLCR